MRKLHLLDRKDQNKRSSTVAKTLLCPRPEETPKYYLGNGNNCELVRRIMKTRPRWQEVDNNKEMFINLRWQQTNKGYKYENCIDNRIFRQTLNHLEYHQELSNKQYLFRNLYDYCEHHKINLFEFVPLTFVLNLTESTFEYEQTFFLHFYNNHKPQAMQLQELNLRRRKMNPNNLFNLPPKTSGHYCKYQITQPFTSEHTPYLWILKPTFYNRGNGVHVFAALSEMEELMSKYIHGVNNGRITTPNKNSPESPHKKAFRIRELKEINSHNVIRSNSFVVQKYMEKPMLANGRKFDIRMWVLVSHQMKVYLFRQGYLRTSSYQYSLNNDKLADLNVHLTNNAVQKYNQDYGRYESGNQLSFQFLRSALKEANSSYDDLMVKLKEIVKLTTLSVRKKINKQERNFCFEIFGFDFMLDQRGNPWLIEVNTNPCLEESSPLLEELLPRMLDDAFSLTIDQIYDFRKSSTNFPVTLQSDKQNLWDLVVDLKRN